MYDNKDLIAELDGIVAEIDRLSPVYFKPRQSAAEYGVDASDLEAGRVIDVFRIEGVKAISVQFEHRGGYEQKMLYRYKTFFYEGDDVHPFCVMRLEVAVIGTCCITRTDHRTQMRENFGPSHPDLAYEEFKYQVITIMKEMGRGRAGGA